MCSLLFVGGAYTDDGGNLFVRVEDGDMNDENKLYLVSPAGKYKAGQVLHGCYGYAWTFTHDSYRYISRRDDDPDNPPGAVFDSAKEYVLYEEAGTNEYGLTVTATQTLDATEAVREADPYIEEGLSENEMATILLSECKTAREAVDLLRRIVERDGLQLAGFGVMLCDQNEQWYAEAVASHYFLAMRLPRDIAFFQANVSVFGLIDLDDENVVATDGIIALAKKAGTFVGDAEQHIIDWRRSLNDYTVRLLPEAWHWNVFERIALTLNWLEDTDAWNVDNAVETNDYVMTNVGEDGSIVPLRNSVKVNRAISLNSLLELLKIYPLGYYEGVETHLYRFYPDAEMELGTVEWSAMDNNQYNVFVPDYPVLTTDTWQGYQASLPLTKLLADDPEYWQELLELDTPIGKLEGERPETKDAYEMKGVYYCLYLICDFTGVWHVFPEGWEKSYSATFSALSNYLTFMGLGEEVAALTKERFAAMQRDFEARLEEMTVRLKAETDLAARRQIATRETSRMAQEAHSLALSLYRHFVYGNALAE